MLKKVYCNLYANYPKRTSISGFGTIISIMLLIYSYTTIKNISFEKLGLIDVLPITFFLGISLLLISSILLWGPPYNRKNENMIFIQLMFFTAGIWLFPFLIEHTASRPTYVMEGFVEYIIRNGKLNPSVAFYHNWPIHSIFFTAVYNILGLSSLSLVKGLTPFFTNMFYFLALCLLRRHFVIDGRFDIWWPFVWMFFIINYINQDVFCPQAIAYFYYLIFVSLFLLPKSKNTYVEGVSGSIIKIILLLSLVASHILTPIILIATIIVFNGLEWFNTRKIISNKLFILAITIFIAWTIYGASVYFNGHLIQFLREAFNLDLFVKQNLGRVSNTGDRIVDRVTILFTGILILLSFIGWIVSEPGLLKTNFTRLSAPPLIVAPFFVYGGEIIARVILFLYLVMAFFIGSFLIRNRKYLLIYTGFLILLLPMHIIAHYGNEEYNFVSKAEQISANFFFSKSAPDYEIVCENEPIFRQKAIEHFNVILLSSSRWEGAMITGPWSHRKDIPQYIALTRGTFVNYDRFKGRLNDIYLFEKELQLKQSYMCLASKK